MQTPFRHILWFVWTRFMVIFIELRLNFGIRGLKIASRANLESGPRLAEVCSQSINCGTNIWILSLLALFTIMWTMLLLTPLVTWRFEHNLLWSKFRVFKFTWRGRNRSSKHSARWTWLWAHARSSTARYDLTERAVHSKSTHRARSAKIHLEIKD